MTASDGLRAASATSPVFTPTKSTPEVYIHSPAQGAVHAGLATIMLHATAYDPEDGALGASSMEWSSDIDGVVATSGVAVIGTGEMTAGTHMLTAIATDSSAMTGTATVTITVRPSDDPPVSADDTAHARAGLTAVVDVAANDTDTEDDLDAHTLAIVAPPALGVATVVNNTSQFVSAVSYRSATAGYDTVVYEICDRARQCTTGELTIFVTDDS